MLASDFQRKLRSLNRNLRIHCGDDDKRLAGLYHVVGGEYQSILGVDKNYLPEWSIVDEQGRLLKSGWRRVVRTLIELKLVDRRRAEKVFGTQIIGTRRPSKPSVWSDPIDKEINAAQIRNFSKTGKPILKADEIMDLAKEIDKKHVS